MDAGTATPLEYRGRRPLQSLRDWLTRVALDKSSSSLPGDLRTPSFAAVFEHCCDRGGVNRHSNSGTDGGQFHRIFLAG